MKRHAYTDETGHSGLKLFDTGQDRFWTGTLISYADLDTAYPKAHKELLSIAGASELHGNELGFGGIDKIGKTIASFIKRRGIEFAFSRVDKKHLAAVKLFDLIFDAGNNLAVPPHAYANQQLRLINALHFVQLLDESELREFWEVFATQDAGRFGSLIKQLVERYDNDMFDQRSRQVLTEALAWAAEHPNDVLDEFGDMHSPNFVAFSGLFGQLHTIHRNTGDTIGSFVHDEQNQFVPMFNQGWDLLSKFEGRNHPLLMGADWQPISSFECELVEKSSHDSFGLQLLDVCLWLVKKVIDERRTPLGGCETLYNTIVERAQITRLDLQRLVEQVRVGAAYVQSLPFTPADERRARKLLEEIEAGRKNRLSSANLRRSLGAGHH